MTKLTVKEMVFAGMVSEGIANWCFGLMERHGLDTNEMDGKDYRWIKAKAEALNALPFPPSQAQKDTINNLVLEIRKHEEGFNIPKDVARALTGGRDGSAGEMIQFLYGKVNKYSGMGAPTDSQTDTLASWLPCIDIDWSEVGLSTQKLYPTPTNPNAWMRLTIDEFKTQIKEKMTKDSASEFIGKNRQVYYQWKSERLNAEQKRTIQTLEERLATLATTGQHGFAQNEKGEIVEVYHKVAELLDNRAYQPLDEFILDQMDKQTASKYITQLESELYKRRKSSIQESPQQQNFEDKAKILSGAKKAETEASNKYQALVDFVFKLEAVGGYENEELHEAVQEVFIKRSMAKTVLTVQLMEMMDYLIDEKFITINGMIDMAMSVELPDKIMQAKYPSEYDLATNGKREVGAGIPVAQLQEQAVVAHTDMKQWMEAVK